MPNVLDYLYTSRGFTLTFGTGGKTLSTGVADFTFHFGPASSNLARTPFGASSQFQVICNNDVAIRPGDFLVLTYWLNQDVLPPRRFRVDGSAEYRHHLNFLSHKMVALSEHFQA